MRVDPKQDKARRLPLLIITVSYALLLVLSQVIKYTIIFPNYYSEHGLGSLISENIMTITSIVLAAIFAWFFFQSKKAIPNSLELEG
jgi:hypothetical protein